MRQESVRIHAFGPFRLEADERRLLRDGAPVALTAKEFDLLLALVERAGRLCTREALVEAVWPDSVIEEHSLTSRVSALRKLLGDEGETPRYIQTVRGRGYRFVAEVQTAAPPAPAAGSAAAPPPPARRRAPAVALAALALVLAGAGLAWHRAAPPTPQLPAADAPPRSIAVLPFANLSADADNAYFAAGVQDMILTKLAGIADLRVISRTSTSRFPSRPDDLRAIGREFGVATVLEGSVQRSGDQVLINVQLIDARTDAHLWAQAYTRPFGNIFEIETDVATRVADALRARLEPAEASRLAEVPTADPAAYDLFLQAEYLAIGIEQGRSNAADAFRRASALYRRAVERDPGFALAKARHAFLQIYAAWFGLDTSPERVADAERLAREALPSGLAQAHLAMGYVHYWGNWDYAAALAEFEQAERALPNDAAVRGAIAFIQRRQGRIDEALAGLGQAELRDPRNPLWFTERASTLAHLRRYADAEQEYNRALAVDPAGHRVVAYKAMVQLCAGRLTDARATLARAPEGTDSTGMLAAARFRLAWLERDAGGALAALAGRADDDWIEEPFMSSLPVGLLRARALALQGDAAAARAEYAKAADAIARALAEHPQRFYLSSLLGLARAGLGQDAEALAAARAGAEQAPAGDLFSAAPYLAALAETQARTGDAPAAAALLRRLLDEPAGRAVSVALLERDPSWDSIRDTPAFRALLAAPGEAAAARADAAGG